MPKEKNGTEGSEGNENNNHETAQGPVATGGIDWGAASSDMTYADEGEVVAEEGVIFLRKPGKERFFQVHPNAEECSMTLSLLEIKDDKDLRGDYLVPPGVEGELRNFLEGQNSLIKRKRVVLCVYASGEPWLWPVAPEGSDNAWHRSAMTAAVLARTGWVRLIPGGSSYAIHKPAAELPEPVWPETPFRELLDSAFEGRVLDSLDHVVVEYLSGAGQVEG